MSDIWQAVPDSEAIRPTIKRNRRLQIMPDSETITIKQNLRFREGCAMKIFNSNLK